MRRQQMIRGLAVDMDLMILPEGVLAWSTDQKKIHMHDGVTPGGTHYLSEEAMAGYSSKLFNVVTQLSVPGAVANVVNRFLEITVAGTYQLPSLPALNVGAPVIISPTVTDVIISATGGTVRFLDRGVASTELALTQNETVVLAKKNDTRWSVITRY